MGASSPWVVVIVAIVGAFGGSPLFKYLAARVSSRAAVSDSERAAFQEELQGFRRERDQFWADQRKEAQSVKLENRTYRDAYNDLSTRNGWLEGQLARCNEQNKEQEAEIARLRGEVQAP